MRNVLSQKRRIDKLPLFSGGWILKGTLCAPLLKLPGFMSTLDNTILDVSGKEMTEFAHEYLNYNRDKELDFVARFNGKYIIRRAKFLTDFGGHQNVQFYDAISTLKNRGVKAIKIALKRLTIVQTTFFSKGQDFEYLEEEIC